MIDKVVGIGGDIYTPPDGSMQVDPDVVAILKAALKSAENGYLQEVCLNGITFDGEAFFDFAGEPFNSTLMYGSLMEGAAQYRESYMRYRAEYDDDDEWEDD